ncbi:glycoside hydrolase superfamily [Lipomyces tetrasporus]|uniref:Glycoside hydrolase superfamily n=1 Tax=Lipomyces tetrasporus TaxID=54092 RepID=A0AAD7QRH8_9ASCO|nr:glycoside hydrolase superfamily [Lipomyces tetrasporus]KAJ8100138.1 glycoside hydrolase superfamily [Lipomyces tetrasporus]
MVVDNSLSAKRPWWKEANVYQIYPASFKDSNGDGVGDIPGIISKLDYIKDLGVDIVWLCPCYKSPQVDMGYDISDYRDIYEKYGTLDDIDDLIRGLHERGLKLVMDLVVNHTSDQHEWFKSAISSKDSPYRDYYVWKKPKIGPNGERLPPNNWLSYFRGSVWEYDEASDEYYLHLFAKEQPDLNWENPKVQAEVHDVIRFWLDRGVDGFRLDAINLISKDLDFPDAAVANPSAKYQDGAIYYTNGPRLHEHLRGMGKIFREYDAFSVGEMGGFTDPNEVIKVVAEEREELNMIFQFEIVDMDISPVGRYFPRKWKLSELKRIVNKWETYMYEHHGWNALYLENHDQGRSVSRFASDKPEFRAHAAKMLATFLGLQSGSVFVYEGQELGMANMPKSWGIDKLKDLESINFYTELVESGASEEVLQVVLADLQKKCRDNARTPMQWDSTAFAGFSTVQPWMDVMDDYKEWNAVSQVDDPSSVYSYWRSIFDLRRAHKDIFVYGSFNLVDAVDEQVLSYERRYEGKRVLVITSFSELEALWTVPEEYVRSGKVLLSNYGDVENLKKDIALRPFEAIVYLLD